MTDEFTSTITSDKVETDNRTFATVRADQTCEEALIPGEEPFRQLEWSVTLEKGSVYNPEEEATGIYAEEIDCKYGVQIGGDMFGRNGISLAHGGSVHSSLGDDEENPVIGTRVLGTVASEGKVEVTEPASKAEDWEERPVTIYGDLFGSHITIDRPLLVYGNIVAENTLRVDAPTVVLGDVRSEGIIEASDLFALTIFATKDIVLGTNAVTINPVVHSAEGEVTLADRVGVLDSGTLATIQEENDLDRIAFGPWLFEEDALWEPSVLYQDDVMSHGDGEVATRTWRTVTEPSEEYAYIQSLVESQVRAFRKDPPDIEQFRYAGLGSVDDMESGPGVEIAHTGDGDIVMGSQQKSVTETTHTAIDNSETRVDQSTEVHDESTTVEDSVVNRSEIGAGSEEE
jgi:hypothetical protein